MKNIFLKNSAIHNVNIRNKDHFHKLTANLSSFQKGASYSDITILNTLPSSLRTLANNDTKSEVALKGYFNTNSFCSVHKFLMFKNNS